MKKQQHYSAALYCRLSVDDGNYGGSVSIETQKIRTMCRKIAGCIRRKKIQLFFNRPQSITVDTGEILLYEPTLPYASGFEVLFFDRNRNRGLCDLSGFPFP